jgi:hypothetical protein
MLEQLIPLLCKVVILFEGLLIDMRELLQTFVVGMELLYDLLQVTANKICGNKVMDLFGRSHSRTSSGRTPRSRIFLLHSSLRISRICLLARCRSVFFCSSVDER